MQANVESTAVQAQGLEPADIFDGKGKNDLNLMLYVTTKHAFEKSFGWGQLPGCPLLVAGLLGNKRMHNIRVLLHNKDLYRVG